MTSAIDRIFKIRVVVVVKNNAANEHFHDFLYNFILCFLSIFIYLNIDFLQSNC